MYSTCVLQSWLGKVSSSSSYGQGGRGVYIHVMEVSPHKWLANTIRPTNTLVTLHCDVHVDGPAVSQLVTATVKVMSMEVPERAKIMKGEGVV